MADDDQPFRPLSGASLGLTVPPSSLDPEPEAGPFDVSPEQRYTAGGVIGRGGMGEIRATFDARLQRVVAVKSPTLNDPVSERRLKAEALLTARLAHPGIVAIYDAGRGPDGRPFYTMPVVRGRSLADAIAGAKLAERLRLMRHFLDACEAVAYAHSAGLLHRDLKPANILVGPFGETIVVDWGLAGPIGERAGSSSCPVGTPGYLAPEQARGEPLFPTADVFSLGVTLRQLITDCHPGDGVLPRAEPGIPPELTAIAERATREHADQRYPDARALADDVAAWFEGRRVTAHRYSLRELVGRTWQTYRVHVIAGLLALMGIAVATGVGYRRTAVEHDRAREAERAAVEARARSDRHLARAEIAQALEAMGRDEWADAEVLASNALVFGESPEARGVLARFDDRARPQLIRRLELPVPASPSRSAVSAWPVRMATRSSSSRLMPPQRSAR